MSYKLFQKHVQFIKQGGQEQERLLADNEEYFPKNTNGSQMLTALNSIEAEP